MLGVACSESSVVVSSAKWRKEHSPQSTGLPNLLLQSSRGLGFVLGHRNLLLTLRVRAVLLGPCFSSRSSALFGSLPTAFSSHCTVEPVGGQPCSASALQLVPLHNAQVHKATKHINLSARDPACRLSCPCPKGACLLEQLLLSPVIPGFLLTHCQEKLPVTKPNTYTRMGNVLFFYFLLRTLLGPQNSTAKRNSAWLFP